MFNHEGILVKDVKSKKPSNYNIARLGVAKFLLAK